MPRTLLLYTLLLSAWFQVNAAVTLKGKAPEYARMTLVVDSYDNLLTRGTQSLGVIQVKPDGSFSATLEIREITHAFVELGKLRAHIYLEPDSTYELVLPPFEPIPDAERFNPFFQPENIQLGILNLSSPNLNEAIQRFDEYYESAFNANGANVVRRQFITLADRMVEWMDSAASGYSHPYFKTYVQYRKAILFSLPRARQIHLVTSRFFSKRPVPYHNPAYFDAIHQIYAGFLPGYLKSVRGKNLAKTLDTSTRFDSACIAFQNDTTYDNPEFSELLLLKSFSDSYYQGTMPKKQVEELIFSAITMASVPENRAIAESLYRKIKYLQPGFPAPEFELQTLKGKSFSLADQKGKFVYLAFMHTHNYACQKDWPALPVIHQHFKRDVLVVVVFTNDNPEEAKRFVAGQKIDFPTLSFQSQQKIVFDYRLKALPAYFLINPEGTLSLSPAPKPDEALEVMLQKTLQDYRNVQYRKDRPKEKSIMDMH